MKQTNSVAQIWEIPTKPGYAADHFAHAKAALGSGTGHALDIGTMSTWLLIAAAGLVGAVSLEFRKESPVTVAQAATSEITEIALSKRLGTADAVPPETNDALPAEPEISEPTSPTVEDRQPPEIPATREIQALPAIPDLPASPEPAARRESHPPVANALKTPTRTGNPVSRGTVTQTAHTMPSISSARRLAGGSTPKPKYPAAARSRGQTGTVVVEFVVGENGRVVSVRAKNPSPWPLLNHAALDAVRGWRFPPGGVATYTRPIIFNLN